MNSAWRPAACTSKSSDSDACRSAGAQGKTCSPQQLPPRSPLQVPRDRQGCVRGPERHPLPRGGALREGALTLRAGHGCHTGSWVRTSALCLSTCAPDAAVKATAWCASRLAAGLLAQNIPRSFHSASQLVCTTSHFRRFAGQLRRREHQQLRGAPCFLLWRGDAAGMGRSCCYAFGVTPCWRAAPWHLCKGARRPAFLPSLVCPDSAAAVPAPRSL